jgi:hypothetical protein
MEGPALIPTPLAGLAPDPRPLWKPLAGSAPLAWLMLLGALAAAGWPSVIGTPLPLPGLAALGAPAAGWPVAAVSLAMALFLSMPRLLTRDRLLVCAGASFCLFAATAFYVSPSAGLLFVFIGANLVRETRQRAE